MRPRNRRRHITATLFAFLAWSAGAPVPAGAGDRSVETPGDSARAAGGGVAAAEADLQQALRLQGEAVTAMEELRLAEALRHVDSALALIEGRNQETLEAGLLAYRGAILAMLQEPEHAEEDLAPLVGLLEREVSRRQRPGTPDLTPLVAVLPELLLASSAGKPEVALESLRKLERDHGHLLPPSFSRLLEMVSLLEEERSAEAAAVCRALSAELEDAPGTTPGPIPADLNLLCPLVDFLAAVPDEGAVDPLAVSRLFGIAGELLQRRPGPLQEPLELLLGQVSKLPEVADDPHEWPSSEELRPALESLDRKIAAAVPPGLRAGPDSLFHLVPQLAVRIRSEAGDASGSFDLSERARSRELLDRLTDAHLAARNQPQQAREVGLLRVRREELERRLREVSWSGGGAEAETLLRELERVRRELGTAFHRVALDRAGGERAEPVSLARIQSALGDHTTLVAYLTSPLGDAPLAWVIDGDEVHLEPLEVEPMALQSDLRLYRHVLREGLPAEALAEHLYRVLWSPLVDLVETRRVLVVPHGPLQELPFAALRDPDTGRWLVEQTSLLYAPSASVWTLLRAQPEVAPGPALVLGDPDGSLRAARTEARQIASLWGVSARLGADASEERLRSAAPTSPLVHVSAHGVLSPGEPFLSHVKLSPSAGGTGNTRRDGRLELHEVVEELDLSGTSLVVLPACHGAEGPRTAGDEVTSLARAFLLAGARSTVTTAWAVGDEEAAALMVDFHRHLVAGIGPVEALRLAQLAAIASPGRSHPSSWAAFALHGAGTPLPRPPS